MWRYAPVLPVSKPASMITLGEGWTPLIHSQGFARACGADDLWIKDDASTRLAPSRPAPGLLPFDVP